VVGRFIRSTRITAATPPVPSDRWVNVGGQWEQLGNNM
jgi:hypothetical protein